MAVIKPKATEISIASANDCANATSIRIFNNAAAVGVVTIAYANGTTYANCTIAGYGELFIHKARTDKVTLASGLAVAAGFWST